MRTSGVLMPVFSLPGRYGIGCFSKEAREFVDFLVSCGMRYWQILPLGPTGYGDSPYQTFSTFAGNPYFISLESLIERGLLKAGECRHLERGTDPHTIDYGRLYKERFKVLKKAFSRFDAAGDSGFKAFCEKHSTWLSDYALFMAIKDKNGGVSFTKWDKDLRFRKKRALSRAAKELSDDILFYEFLQYEFYTQYFELKSYANEKGIGIIGDIPIYVSPDSSELWARPELFRTDGKGELAAVAGCPPDGFTPDGQLWGNPLYDWDHHKSTGYEWWISRIKSCTELYDVVRIDHFRGFDEYYSIPFGDKNARGGHWEKGPGYELFDAVKKALGKVHVIAEDLGFITPSVRRLVKKTGFPNMKVLEFAFDSGDLFGANEYLPHNYPENCVVYTGTHDNETLAGYLKSVSPAVRRRIAQYTDVHTRDVEKRVYALIRLALSCSASYCIIPLQDYLCLGNEARINYPSTLGGNWVWRVDKESLTEELAQRIKELNCLYGRSAK